MLAPQQLLNIKTVAKRAENMLWHKLPPSIYFRRGCLPEAIKELAGKKRALLVTDPYLYHHGHADELIAHLKHEGLEVEVFSQVEADPTLTIVRKCTEVAAAFRPDVIVAFGGGSPMDAAKIAWGALRTSGGGLPQPSHAVHGYSEAHLPLPEAWQQSHTGRPFPLPPERAAR